MRVTAAVLLCAASIVAQLLPASAMALPPGPDCSHPHPDTAVPGHSDIARSGAERWWSSAESGGGSSVADAVRHVPCGSRAADHLDVLGATMAAADCRTISSPRGCAGATAEDG